MDISPKFLKYEENNDQSTRDKGFLGIITFSTHNNTEIHSYKVQQGKEGKGFFIVSFSTKMNDNWYKSHTMDSNYLSGELENFLRKAVTSYYNGTKAVEPKATQSTFDDGACPF